MAHCPFYSIKRAEFKLRTRIFPSKILLCHSEGISGNESWSSRKFSTTPSSSVRPCTLQSQDQRAARWKKMLLSGARRRKNRKCQCNSACGASVSSLTCASFRVSKAAAFARKIFSRKNYFIFIYFIYNKLLKLCCDAQFTIYINNFLIWSYFH